MTEQRERPLDGLLVLDLTRALAGPIAGRLLADLGAEVIKVEPPAGDLTRTSVPRVRGMAAYFAQCNVGKQCVSIDLTRPEGRDLFLTMVERADVVLENYRSEVMGRLGLDYEVLAAHNPRVIMASISGWGRGNSRSDQGAFAPTIQAETGITEAVARRRGDKRPRNDPVSHADVYAGLHALAGLLAALYQRERTGRGQALEVSMAEAALVANDLTSVELTGEDPQEGFRPGSNWPPIYTLASGRHVCVTADPAVPGAFAVWIRGMGRPELAEDPRFATMADRLANATELDALIGAWVGTFERAEDLEAALPDGAVLAAEVRSVSEAAELGWVTERGAFVELDVGGEPITVPQSPWRFSAADAGAVPRIGFRGQDNAEVLVERFGFAPDEIERLTEEGVLSSRLPSWLPNEPVSRA